MTAQISDVFNIKTASHSTVTKWNDEKTVAEVHRLNEVIIKTNILRRGDVLKIPVHLRKFLSCVQTSPTVVKIDDVFVYIDQHYILDTLFGYKLQWLCVTVVHEETM